MALLVSDKMKEEMERFLKIIEDYNVSIGEGGKALTVVGVGAEVDAQTGEEYTIVRLK